MFKTLRRHPLLVLSQAARDPLDALAMLQDSFYSRIEPVNAVGYIEDSDWAAATGTAVASRPDRSVYSRQHAQQPQRQVRA